MHTIILVADNIRSTHNVGSLLRTCDGLGISAVYLCGITPYPLMHSADTRLPHLSHKISKDIHKTALGAEHTVTWRYFKTTSDAVAELKNKNFTVVALEQAKNSILLQDYKLTHNTALIVGPEVTGISDEILSQVDTTIEIPMQGTKESLNVSVAAAIALYALQQQN